MPVSPPALTAMAIDDIAQGSGHGVLDAAAQAAPAMSLAHGVSPIAVNRSLCASPAVRALADRAMRLAAQAPLLGRARSRFRRRWHRSGPLVQPAAQHRPRQRRARACPVWFPPWLGAFLR